MAKYLLEVNYTLDGVRGVRAEGGSARRSVAEGAAASVGGQLEQFYFALGDTDAFLIAELPDNVAAAALSLAVAAAGGATIRTVALLTTADIDAAVGKDVGYRPPGG